MKWDLPRKVSKASDGIFPLLRTLGDGTYFAVEREKQHYAKLLWMLRKANHLFE